MYFAEIEKTILKFIWNLKGPQIAKQSMKKKNEVGGLTLPTNLKYSKQCDTGIKTNILTNGTE